MDETPRMRVAELSAKVGTSPDLLRAWERRYRLVEPARSEGGFRLYSAADEWRVRLMLEKLGDGRSAAEAAREVLSTDHRTEGVRSLNAGPAAREVVAELSESLEAFDEERAHESLDRLFGLLGVEEAIRRALLPYLRALGERWASGEISVAQEHYASSLLEGRLLALARGWNRGPGPKAVLACPPGEQHTLPLICFGLVLRGRGWRNVYLGADSPAGAVGMAAETVGADLVVLSAVATERFEPVLGQLKRLGSRWRVVIAGAGATAELAARARIEYASGDPTRAAGRLSVDQASKRSAVTN